MRDPAGAGLESRILVPWGDAGVWLLPGWALGLIPSGYAGEKSAAGGEPSPGFGGPCPSFGTLGASAPLVALLGRELGRSSRILPQLVKSC